MSHSPGARMDEILSLLASGKVLAVRNGFWALHEPARRLTGYTAIRHADGRSVRALIARGAIRQRGGSFRYRLARRAA